VVKHLLATCLHVKKNFTRLSKMHLNNGNIINYPAAEQLGVYKGIETPQAVGN